MVSPYFPEYKVWIESCGCTCVEAPAKPYTFQLSVGSIMRAITPRTAAIIVNSPNNPTGAVYSRDVLERLANCLLEVNRDREAPIFIISDEPYRETRTVRRSRGFRPSTSIRWCAIPTPSRCRCRASAWLVLVPPSCHESARVMAAVAGSARALGFVCAPSLFQRVVIDCVDEPVMSRPTTVTAARSCIPWGRWGTQWSSRRVPSTCGFVRLSRMPRRFASAPASSSCCPCRPIALAPRLGARGLLRELRDHRALAARLASAHGFVSLEPGSSGHCVALLVRRHLPCVRAPDARVLSVRVSCTESAIEEGRHHGIPYLGRRPHAHALLAPRVFDHPGERAGGLCRRPRDLGIDRPLEQHALPRAAYSQLPVLPQHGDLAANLGGVTVLHGCEADIEGLDGSLFGQDIPCRESITGGTYASERSLFERVTESADYVIASVHNTDFAKGCSISDITDMYVAVLEQPRVFILGHTGRSGLPYDLDTVLACAKEHHKLIEVNEHSLEGGSKHEGVCRKIAERCAEMGVGIAVSSDAHIAPQIGRFSAVERMLEEIHFPEELIMNRGREPFLRELAASGVCDLSQVLGEQS